MKFLCVPCDSPMKLQTVGRPSAARSRSSTPVPSAATRWRCSPIRSRPRSSSRSACGSVPDGARRRPALQRQADKAGGKCPFAAMIPATQDADAARPSRVAGPVDRRAQKRGSRTFPSSSAPWRGPASRSSRRSEGLVEVDETILDAARDFFGM